MPVRLNKALKEIGVGINTVAEFLQNKGYALQDASPNAEITDEQYRILMETFGENKRKQEEIQKHLEKKRMEEEHPNQEENQENVEPNEVSNNKEENNGFHKTDSTNKIKIIESKKELNNKTEDDLNNNSIEEEIFNGISIGKTSVEWNYGIVSTRY